MKFKNRVRIEGVLTTRSNFHLGDGGTTTRSELTADRGRSKGKKIEIASVATDHAGQAYIPGTSLKGSLRSWLESRHADPAIVEQVFGSERTGKEVTSYGGKAEFWDAAAAPDEGISVPPHWNAKRLTGVVASVAIDRYTRAAVDKRLFHREVVPPGVTFKITISGQDLAETEIALLLQALRSFSDDHRPVRLGSDGGGWGLFEWNREQESVHMLVPEGVPDWLSEGHSGYAGLKRATKGAQTQIEEEISARTLNAPRSMTIALEIHFQGPFLVNDPSRTKKPDEMSTDKWPDHAPLLDRNGCPALPVSSVRGVLRARSERIGRTLGLHVCDPNSPTACVLTQVPGEVDLEKRLAVAVKGLCLVCRMFGAPGWASRCDLSSFEITNKPAKFHQELVAIDRFTGGVAGSAKFDVEAFWKPEYKGSILIDGNVDRASLGLLALTLRDLEEGDLTFGFGAAKGYGDCRATVTWPAPHDRDAAIAEVRRMAGTIAPSSAAPNAPSQPDAPPPTVPAQGSVEGEPFYNPYHFVPATCSPRNSDVSVAQFSGRTIDRIGHARLAEEGLSGRLLCRLTVEKPVVVGARHEPRPSDYTIVHPFRVPTGGHVQEEGEVAIPATSLRGLLSSVVEAASNSALRVLEDEMYSHRCAMEESLQAIGEIVGTRVRPLALPALEGRGPAPSRFAIGARYRKIFSPESFKSPPLKAYVEGYEKVRDGGAPYVRPATRSFLAEKHPASRSADHKDEIWFAKLDGSATFENGSVSVRNCNVKPGKRTFLLGNTLVGSPISASDYTEKGSPGGYTRGVLRVLGVSGRESEIPTQKKHEMFVPYPEEMEKVPLLEASDAIAEFHALAKERTDSQKRQIEKADLKDRFRIALPFSVEGSKRNDHGKPDDQTLQLRDGDLVFFEPSEDGTRVERLAVSSIWRKRITGSTFDFFKRISPELLPFNPTREWLTVAELMFGFVEKNVAPEQDARALAGRVQISFGRLAAPNQDPLMKSQKLKILSSPKPPSPNLYFRRNGTTGYTAKRDLSSVTHTPQGRKFYLHASSGQTEPWKTAPAHLEKDKEQKASVRPVNPGTKLYFHVDFTNLSQTELDLLCYSLVPSPVFRHKLGMGKSIGLGTVRIEPVAHFAIDRRQRYASDSVRYHGKWISADAEPVNWPDRYQVERDCAGNREVAADRTSLVHRANRYRTVMDKDIRHALDLIGDPAFVQHHVNTPQSGADIELKTFQWFVENDRNRKQYLVPLHAGSGSLPPLYQSFDGAFPRDAAAIPPRVTPTIEPPTPIISPVQPPPVPDIVPPPVQIPPSTNEEERMQVRIRLHCHDAPLRFVVRDTTLGILPRMARGTEQPVARKILQSPDGMDMDVTLKGTRDGKWQIEKVG